MPILNSLLSWVMKKRIHQMELFMKFPFDVQNELLDDLISSSNRTEWGKKYETYMKKYIIYLLKGMAVGLANIIPGVSGGTIALITGIFERLINSIKNSTIWQRKWKNFQQSKID